jgi:hypothetical protein
MDKAPESALRPLYTNPYTNRGVRARTSLPLLIPSPSEDGIALSFHGGGTPRSLQIFRTSLSGISVWRGIVEDLCASRLT